MGYSLVPKWLFWVLIVFILHSYESNACIEKEKFALLQIKKHLISISSIPNHHHFLPSWIDDKLENCCLWERVRCDHFSDHIIQLSLGSLINLTTYGFYVSEIDKPQTLNMSVFQDFEELQDLDLSINSITSLVKEEVICKLRKLKSLDLSQNQINGGIPNCFSDLSFLSELDLSYNRFTGDIPSGVCKLKRLQFLDLSNNLLNESIPKCIGNLSSLQYLELSLNDELSVSIVPGLCGLIKLEWLSLSSYYIKNSLPSCVGNLTSLLMLELGGYNFIGTISPWLCKLVKLQYLYFSGNHFHENIPNCIGNFTYLKVIDLEDNHFTSTKNIPSTISNITNLETLSMSNNSFEGKFSLSILSKNAKLTTLELLDNNRLEIETEDLPWSPSFQLQSLVFVGSTLNKKTKIFPTFISHQYHLQKLEMPGHNLVGSFSTSLFQSNSRSHDLILHKGSYARRVQSSQYKNISSSRLWYLNLCANKFSGKLPRNIGLVLSNVQYLYLSGNNFEGQIPNSISKMAHIGWLDLSDNHFEGKVPKQLLYNSNLKWVRLSKNNFNGSLSLFLDDSHFNGTIRGSLLKSSDLEALDISYNRFSGELPSWIGDFKRLQYLSVRGNILHGQTLSTLLCKISSLVYLDLSSNRFSGTISSCIGTLLRLEYLQMNNNNLSGKIPHELSKSSSLEVLDLRSNHLIGSIPLSIGQLSRLKILQLGKNKLQGVLPSQLCHLKHLNILDMSSNEISGTIPPCLKDVSFGVTTILFKYSLENYLDFVTKGRYNSYIGYSISQMSGLDLSCNQLSGQIPLELGYLNETQSLNLSHNKFTGLISKTFSMLRNIESLDLSYNNLSGPIPSELVNLNFLEVFNVSYNNLSGRVPITQQFATFDESSYLHNPFLYGYVDNTSSIVTKTPNATVGEDREKNGQFDWEIFFWSFGSSCLIFLLGSILVAYNNPRWLNACLIFIDTYIRLYF